MTKTSGMNTSDKKKWIRKKN